MPTYTGAQPQPVTPTYTCVPPQSPFIFMPTYNTAPPQPQVTMVTPQSPVTPENNGAPPQSPVTMVAPNTSSSPLRTESYNYEGPLPPHAVPVRFVDMLNDMVEQVGVNHQYL
ncbi:hypothetical protein DPMN_055851 [Dreissena polymorpha]|uniref:Uncharacterized protein n=1 Tax=Dreissena polymorpha TaxID=45954 RepID=A0A9D4CQN8_DREPO|nr:hypothetical protein DPMN_055851 [Dreissena polymorpha]